MKMMDVATAVMIIGESGKKMLANNPAREKQGLGGQKKTDTPSPNSVIAHPMSAQFSNIAAITACQPSRNTPPCLEIPQATQITAISWHFPVLTTNTTWNAYHEAPID